MKTAGQYAEEFYELRWNNYDSVQDLTRMFKDYAQSVANKALEDAAETAKTTSNSKLIDAILKTEINPL
jgi:hypothetical protein